MNERIRGIPLDPRGRELLPKVFDESERLDTERAQSSEKSLKKSLNAFILEAKNTLTSEDLTHERMRELEEQLDTLRDTHKNNVANSTSDTRTRFFQEAEQVLQEMEKELQRAPDVAEKKEEEEKVIAKPKPLHARTSRIHAKTISEEKQDVVGGVAPITSSRRSPRTLSEPGADTRVPSKENIAAIEQQALANFAEAIGVNAALYEQLVTENTAIDNAEILEILKNPDIFSGKAKERTQAIEAARTLVNDLDQVRMTQTEESRTASRIERKRAEPRNTPNFRSLPGQDSYSVNRTRRITEEPSRPTIEMPAPEVPTLNRTELAIAQEVFGLERAKDLTSKYASLTLDNERALEVLTPQTKDFLDTHTLEEVIQQINQISTQKTGFFSRIRRTLSGEAQKENALRAALQEIDGLIFDSEIVPDTQNSQERRRPNSRGPAVRGRRTNQSANVFGGVTRQ